PAFGVEAPITVDTAMLCNTCHGAGTAPGTHVATCEVCGGRGEVQSVQRTFLGQVVSSRPCGACAGYGSVITRPCPGCAGDGRVRTRRTLTVKIPAGVEDQMRIRLAGQGEVGPGGGPPGDLYVEIHERPHDVFSRKGDDLHCRVTLPMTAAALGTKLTIKTLDGEENIECRAGTQPGSTLRLSDGRGGRACAVVAAVGRGRLELSTHQRWYVPPPAPRLVVAQGIAKGDRGELAVQVMTEVGVDEIVPWTAARSVARWKDDRPLERWRATAREAAKQARRAWLPVVSPSVSTSVLA